jgi:tetratricopeptide (TPR) repeat protein
MSTESAATSAPSVESEVQRIYGLVQQRQFAEALNAAQPLVASYPQNRDLLYCIAVCQRYLHKLPEALATLERLERHHPGFSRLYQERGHCYIQLRDAPHAIEAFLQAVNINPALPASWSKLQSLYRMNGDAESERLAAEHVATLARLAPEVITATGYFSDGDLGLAERLIRPYLLKHEHDVEGMRLLARIGIARDVLDDAEILLASVLALAPDYRAARHDYANVLLKRHKHAAAMAELERLLAADPGNRAFRTTYGAACVGIGDHERALAVYRDLLVGAPQTAEIRLSIAHTLKTLGRPDEAIAEYRAAAAERPSFGDAYWSLANLKTYRFTDEELARMRSRESSADTALADRFHLCFALGKALEDRGDYEESWRYYERGNRLKKSESRFRIEQIERNTRLQKAVCTAEFFAERRSVGCPSPDPIFIVGLPRSGSTLLEQILASHSHVEGTMELADIPRIVLELQGRQMDSDDPLYPGVLARLTPEEFRRLGEKYIGGTRIYRTNKPRFIDKMPNNFRHIGLIHLMLPNARIIDARREPMACCFSNFKQLFAQGQEFTYSLEDIGRYYRTYVELMAHWERVLPGRVLRVQHESVVEDLEGNVRRILEFCGLGFETACIEFHKTERSVRTASSEQVRQPIYREGVDQWRNYAPWLGPLRAVLGDLVPDEGTAPSPPAH